eukprot:2779847-Amphidinium_carterae.1
MFAGKWPKMTGENALNGRRVLIRLPHFNLSLCCSSWDPLNPCKPRGCCSQQVLTWCACAHQ